MTAQAEAPRRRGISSWWLIVLAVVIVVLLAVVGGQAVGVLAVIAFPPAPPLPPNVNELAHTNQDYGVDEWLYALDQDACQVTVFYQGQSGTCEMASTACSQADGTPSGGSGEQVATCSGVYPISVFALRWQAVIMVGSAENQDTRLRITREMLWSGMPRGDRPPS